MCRCRSRWPRRSPNHAKHPLTPREVEVATLTLSGADTRSITAELHMSAGTVRNHVSSIIAKTHTGNRYEAARVARDQGWL